MALEESAKMPDFNIPGAVRGVRVKFCGSKLKRSAEFQKFVDECVPAKFQDRFAKSEKGIDVEICCDILKLAFNGRLDRACLITNDSDCIPLFRTLRETGVGVDLIYLSSSSSVNADLLREVDSYELIANLVPLEQLFLPAADATEADEAIRRGPEAEKPVEGPSEFSQLADLEPLE